MITLLLSVMLAATDATATATAATTPAVASQSAEAPKSERKICKRDRSTESRLGSKRTCLTAAEWKAREGDGVKGLGDVVK